MKNPIPNKVRRENLRFYRITQIVYFIGMGSHLSAVFMFWWLGVFEMAYFNLFFSFPAFVFALILNRLGKHSFAFGLAFLELYFHQVLAIYFTGWGFGFQFWMIYLAALSFFNPRWNIWVNFIGLFLVVAGLFLLYFYAHEGVYDFDPEFMKFNYIINLISIAGLVSILINYYAKSTLRAERKLVAEKEITERQNNQLIEQHEKLVD